MNGWDCVHCGRGNRERDQSCVQCGTHREKGRGGESGTVYRKRSAKRDERPLDDVRLARRIIGSPRGQ